MKRHATVPFRQALIRMASMVLGLGLFASIAQADTPPASVTTTTVSPGQSYPEVPAHGEGWFDVGGYCKVVDVGDLSALGPTAIGVPVFIPGPAAQWENYRTLAGAHYSGQLVLTTCCRPQSNITNLCTEAGASVVSVSRQYGKVGEVDTVTATCTDRWGRQYQDQVNVECEVAGGSTDGPDAQGEWVESGSDSTSGCTANAYTSPCSASCPTTTGTTVTYTSCGTVQSVNACSISCCTPSYSYACNGSSYVRTDSTCGTGSAVVGTCTYVTGSTTISCGNSDTPDPVSNSCGGTTTYFDCGNSWPSTAGYTSCTPNACSPEPASYACCSNGQCSYGGSPCGVSSITCTYSYWSPP